MIRNLFDFTLKSTTIFLKLVHFSLVYTEYLAQSQDTKLCSYLRTTEALKYYGSRLSEYERVEIEKYPEIWYLGLDACKIHGEEGLSQNGGFDDDNGSYNKVSR